MLTLDSQGSNHTMPTVGPNETVSQQQNNSDDYGISTVLQQYSSPCPTDKQNGRVRKVHDTHTQGTQHRCAKIKYPCLGVYTLSTQVVVTHCKNKKIVCA